MHAVMKQLSIKMQRNDVVWEFLVKFLCSYQSVIHIESNCFHHIIHMRQLVGVIF